MLSVRFPRVFCHLISFSLFTLLFVQTAVAATIDDTTSAGSQLETPLERSVRVNSGITPKIDRASTLKAPVTDPNFNVMRNRDIEKGKAKFYVVGLLILATIVPLITWLAFSR